MSRGSLIRRTPAGGGVSSHVERPRPKRPPAGRHVGTGSDRGVQGLLERQTAIEHQASNDRIGVQVKRDGGPYDCIIAS
jgi:hypothetical protein